MQKQYLKYVYVLILNLYPIRILEFLMDLDMSRLMLLLVYVLDLLSSLDPMDWRCEPGRG